MQSEMPIVTRPPLRYHGGKFQITPWIIGLFPDHQNYVEVFGGGAGVLLRKPRSTVEVYNDLDFQCVSLFRILRDPELRDRLCSIVELTPFSREEFELCHHPADDPVEAARRFVFRCQAGHGTTSVDTTDSNGFRSCDIRAGKSYAREWTGLPSAIAIAGKRFQGVTIEQLDFRRLIQKFDDPETLFFCDPPYPSSTRDAAGKGYVHEMSDDDHEQLAWLLHQIKGRALVTSYPSKLYSRLYRGWNTSEKYTTANGQRGAVPRTEIAYMNYEKKHETGV